MTTVTRELRETQVDPNTAHLLAGLSADYLHLILMPTEACNFRCAYCYEDFALGRMSAEVERSVLRLLTRRAPQLGQLDLSWFGGEPLLATGVVERVLRHVRGLARRHPGLRVRSDMTTNGFTLNPALFRRLLRLGLGRFQIALDGPKEHHDQVRTRGNGVGTFDRIWSNLEAIRREPGPFRITVRLHLSGANHRELPAFFDAYQEALGGDARFGLFLRPLSRWGGPRDEELPFLDRADRQEILAGLEREALARGIRLERPGVEDPVCYAARPWSFVVRSDGRLGKCTLALDHPMNQVGRLLPDGQIQIELERLRGWSRGLWTGDLEEQRCPMRGYADRQPERSPVRWVA
jgi:uncharacterized protein